jgi:hypothetical protein
VWRDLPITRAVQQVAPKTRITTRRNILKPDLLPSVWPRCWVQLIYSGEIFTNLTASRHLMIRYHSCGGVSYSGSGSGLLQLYCYVISLLCYDLHDCISRLIVVCKLIVTAWVLIKVKVSLTSHDDSDMGWNVWHSPLLWNSAQFWRQSCQLYAPTARYPQVNSLAVISFRGWMGPSGTECGQKN